MESIRKWKQCRQCGYSTAFMTENKSSCGICQKRAHTPENVIEISPSSTPGTIPAGIKEKFEAGMRHYREEVRSTDVRVKGDKKPKIEVVAARQSFGNSSSAKSSHQQLEKRAKAKAFSKANDSVLVSATLVQERPSNMKKRTCWPKQSKI